MADPLSMDRTLDRDSTNYPGASLTIGQRGSDRPALKYLNRYVIPHITECWHEVGLELLEPERENEAQLKIIKNEPGLSSKERADKMLTFWLDKSPAASWNDLIRTLRVPSIGLHTTAFDIEGKLLATQHKNEAVATYLEVTSNASTNVEKFSITNRSHQQIPKDNTSSEIPTGLCNKALSPLDESTQSGCMTYSANITSNGEKPKRVCEAVSEYYAEQFVNKWKIKTDCFTTINNLAALLVERDDTMKVVVFAAGTTKNGECSYDESVDESMWGHCDGHAVSVCYRFASFYLITEMNRYKKNPEMSILKMGQGGYELKEGIKIHLFSTNVPCGFMANKDHGCLSWKIPFKETPHCLKCSSIILLSAYLGIQGPLSHLFSKPVYISSITIPHCESIAAAKAAEIKSCFDTFDGLLNEIDNYKFHIPHVEIAERKSDDLFEEYFVHNKSISHVDLGETVERQDEVTQAAGTVLDPDGNAGSHMMVFTLKDGIGSKKFREKMTSQLKYAIKEFSSIIKEAQLNSLVKALKRLSEVLNIDQALENFRKYISKKINERFAATDCQSSGKVILQLKEMEQCRSKTDELTTQTDGLKDSLCTILEKFKNDCSIKKVTDSLSSLSESSKQFETDAKLMIKSLNSLNKSLKEFKDGTKSLVDELTSYHDYKEALDNLTSLLKTPKSCDTQLFLELMGCDWARYLKAIHNNIQGLDHNSVHQTPASASAEADKDQQQQFSGSHVPEIKAEQESQDTEEDLHIVKPKDRVISHGSTASVITSSHGSLYQVTNLLNSTKGDGNEVVPELRQEPSNEKLLYSKRLEVATGSCSSVANVSSLLQSEDPQIQGSKLVIGNNVERSMENSQPLYYAAVWEENQHIKDGNHNSVQQVSLPMYQNQQHYSSGDDKDSGFNNRTPNGKLGLESKENESNNEETNVLEETDNKVEEKSQTGTVKFKESNQNSMHQLHSTAHHDNNQVTYKVVPKDSSNIEEQQSQNQEAEGESVQTSMLSSNDVSEIDIGNITQKMATACAVTNQQNVSRKKLKKNKKFHVKGEH